MSTERQYFFETIVLLQDTKYSDEVKKYFSNAGLTVLPMKEGLLVSGGAEEFTAATGADPNLVEKETTLPIPKSVEHAVRSIEICPVVDPTK